jgi:hypothetical protein
MTAPPAQAGVNRRQLAALVATQRLRPGDELFHSTLHGGELIARVVVGGLQVDGKVYPSPSSAARAAAGHSTNGWTFWHVRSTGATIETLRLAGQ